MEPRRYVSTQQVSQALGVGVTTVKRWVDDGTLPARRTAGGHRKILRADVLRLVRERGWPHRDLTLLLGTLPAQAATPENLREQLYPALMAGDAAASRNLLLDAHLTGAPVDHLADEVIAPVLARVGHGWAEGHLDIYQEHVGTQTCLAALLALRARLSPPEGGERPLAVGGGPEHDHYLLANLLAEMTLWENGWAAMNIGPNTPLGSFRRVLAERRPRLLWLSCGHLADEEAFLREYAELYADAQRAGVAVAVGGRALTGGVRGRMLFTHHGDKMAHLGAFARELHPDVRRG